MDVTAVGTLVVRGQVEQGDRRGRTIGFPTANLPIEGTLIDDGVWAGFLDRASGQRHPAAISIGTRPTFYGVAGFRLLEVHVIDFDADLYGEIVTVWLGKRLRGQQRFSGLQPLVEQLRRDVAAAEQWCRTADWHPALALAAAMPVGSAMRLALSCADGGAAPA